MMRNIQLTLGGIVGILLAYMYPGYCNNIEIQKFAYNNNGFGVYSFEYETSDGTFRREEGGNSPGTSDLVVRGEFGYIDPRGRLYTVRYVADANGYRPITEEDTRFNDRNMI